MNTDITQARDTQNILNDFHLCENIVILNRLGVKAGNLDVCGIDIPSASNSIIF